ncbi:hypothetical protein CICLE_v10006340mg [Citrus x clementina]|uniref:Uncharacterized protein n=1 Tax=Citrus clementina TaxID=85681 RepID=V4RHJ3_CITCL|nr:hypothetical protein CICLE_v10006340mg [Citrus x clementina]ESR33449.1 hypothetical protein CICLE_v10006340mg [Citrus x clementina]
MLSREHSAPHQAIFLHHATPSSTTTPSRNATAFSFLLLTHDTRPPCNLLSLRDSQLRHHPTVQHHRYACLRLLNQRTTALIFEK